MNLLPDNAQYTNRFEIKSETSNRIYVVAQDKKTKKFKCSCPGWITSGKCKHLKAMELPPDGQTRRRERRGDSKFSLSMYKTDNSSPLGNEQEWDTAFNERMGF